MRTKKAIAAQFLAEARAHCEIIAAGAHPVCHGGILLDLDVVYGEVLIWDDLSFAETQQAIIFALVWGAEMLLRGRPS